jgi:choline-glycine betaine transporter
MALSTYTTKELLKKLKKQQTMFAIQGVIILLMLVFAVFSSIENGLSIQSFLPLFFAPMLFVMLFEVKKIKKELRSRT